MFFILGFIFSSHSFANEEAKTRLLNPLSFPLSEKPLQWEKNNRPLQNKNQSSIYQAGLTVSDLKAGRPREKGLKATKNSSPPDIKQVSPSQPDLFIKRTEEEKGKTIENEIIIYDININTQNQKLKSYLTKVLFKYKNKKFSKQLSNEIHNVILLSLKEKKILLPEITEPLFDFSGNRLTISYEIKNPYRYGFIIKGNTALDRYSLISRKRYEKYFNNSQLIRKILSQIRELYLKKRLYKYPFKTSFI